jgi:hypothetical protein
VVLQLGRWAKKTYRKDKLVTKYHKGPQALTDFLNKLPKLKKIDWIDLAKDREQWRALVNTVMNLRVP